MTLFIKFVGAGCGSAIVQYGTLFLLVELFSVPPVLASSWGALLGALVNYLLNYHLTFRSDKSHGEALAKFLLVAGVGLALNTFFMSLATHWLHWNYLLSQLGTTSLVLLWSFTANRLWTFARSA